jgi:3-oxoacyl-[acyl-carrier protein] reductase
MTTALLDGQVAFITGATGGIGKAIALLFAKQGAHVIVCGTNQGRGEACVTEANELTGRDACTFLQLDVSSKEQVELAIQKILEKFSKIDILVNNAGITKDGLLLRMSEEDIDRVLAVNLKSCFFTSQAVLRPFMKARKGKIINISSVVGLMGNAGQTNYAASKAGMIGFSKSLAKEVASRNITVNCIAPGYIDTNMTEALGDEKKQAVIAHIPLGRMGEASDIANAALYLASSMADYVTGQVLVVDGGLVM